MDDGASAGGTMTAIQDEYEGRLARWSDIVDHLPRLYQEACRPGVKVIELGVRSGNSTAAFVAAAEANDGHLWSVDIDWSAHPEIWYKSGRWTFTVGDDMDLSVFEQHPDGVDVLFIDTSHHYQHTLLELGLWVPKVKPGGVVLLHDTELEQPYAAPSDDPAFPVQVAAAEFASVNGLAVEWVTGCYGLGVIRV